VACGLDPLDTQSRMPMPSNDTPQTRLTNFKVEIETGSCILSISQQSLP
jgi:hypothetical protein